MTLILASQSPRRKELLAQMGYQFTCCPADIDETVQGTELPAEYVSRLAIEKAQHVAKQYDDNCVVLGSDTTVVMHNMMLGKPESYQACYDMLKMLSGDTHQVFTAIAAVKSGAVQVMVIITDVSFKSLTETEILNYWQTGEPHDKAGSYGIQGIGGQFVSEIKGSYSSVVGLPLYETTQLLSAMGIANPLTQSK
ncbi:Maf family protein [Thalassotalea atypica]|uniref:Maf family protein n=1 Tax=Thalassotalea atypica TaxID=2054316 RepID=UPI002573ACEE|nr:Maf family protein [Thalassotalea atypica]